MGMGRTAARHRLLRDKRTVTGQKAGWTVRGRHGTAGAMGSWKAPLKLAETKGTGSQRFPHPKIELSERPELFGSTFKSCNKPKIKLSKEPSRRAAEGCVKHEVPAASSARLSSCQERPRGKAEHPGGSAGAWEPPAKSTTPTPAFLQGQGSVPCPFPHRAAR